MSFHNKLNGKTYNTLGGMVRTFRLLGYTPKQYYDEFEKKDGEGVCSREGCVNMTKYAKFSYYKFCSLHCAGVHNENMVHYLSNLTPSQRISYGKKISKIAKASHSGEEWLLKRAATIKERYNISETEMKRANMIKRYSRMTDSERQEYFDKATTASVGASYRLKPYRLAGEEIFIQGYENRVLDCMKSHFDENEILAGRKNGFFRYTSEAGTDSRYFPDIKFRNYAIEVKSMFTLTRDKNLFRKLASVYEYGYIPMLVLWDPKQSQMCENDLIETISSRALWYKGRFNDYPFIGVGYKQMIAEALSVQALDDDIVCSGSREPAGKSRMVSCENH